ncbi:hypothetical protein [Amycolatopsis sp. lyj-84]|uniref:hypothetical protein n=1 Tax=Amycolatopsis sp. lyj-84 TaxID=2789284 RepID=UPI00397AE679
MKATARRGFALFALNQGGRKASGIGHENHKMMLDHCRQTKNMLVSYSDSALGFF